MTYQAKKTIYLGRILHCKSLSELEELKCVAVEENGTIVFVSKDDHGWNKILDELRWDEQNVKLVRIKKNQFLFPGFIGE